MASQLFIMILGGKVHRRWAINRYTLQSYGKNNIIEIIHMLSLLLILKTKELKMKLYHITNQWMKNTAQKTKHF